MPSYDVSASSESVSCLVLSALDSDAVWSCCVFDSASSFNLIALSDFLSRAVEFSVKPSADSPEVLGSDHAPVVMELND